MCRVRVDSPRDPRQLGCWNWLEGLLTYVFTPTRRISSVPCSSTWSDRRRVYTYCTANEIQKIIASRRCAQKRKCKRQATQDTKPDVCQTTGRRATLILLFSVAQSGEFESICNSSRMSMRRIIRWNYFGVQSARTACPTHAPTRTSQRRSLCRFTRTPVDTGSPAMCIDTHALFVDI